MATAGFSGVVAVSTDDSTYNALNGCNSVSMPTSRAMLDITDFEDTSVNRIAGLKDSSASLSGHFDHSDTAQAALRAAAASGATVYVRYLYDGTNGTKIAGIVESFELSATPDGTVEFSCTVQANAAWTIV